MAALVRTSCPRLRTTTTLRGTPTSSSPPPLPPGTPQHRRHALDTARVVRCYIRCSARLPSSCLQTTTPKTIRLAQQCRSFRSTRASHADLSKRNHYERLQVSPTATPGEIKKSFYKLSKAHHPDANRNDPNAAHTFSLLSESYTLLSDPSRRAVYDRDVMRHLLHQQPHSHHHHHHHGSYHSSSSGASYSAGGRPPSGLSKRRGTFRGPPPSFYRSGGWGAQAEKRRRAHEESTSYSSSSRADETSSRPQYTHFEAGGDAFAQQQAPGGKFYRDEDIVPPHFDKEAHRRTHENEDRRRWARQQQQQQQRRALDDDDDEFEPQTSLAAHFAIVLGILGATVLVPVWYLNVLSGNRKKRDYER